MRWGVRCAEPREGRQDMAHTYTNLLTHIIFSTKSRDPVITPALREDLLAYVGGIVRELRGTLRAARARPDLSPASRAYQPSDSLPSRR